MKRLFVSIFLAYTLIASAQTIGEWTTYPAFSDITEVEEAGSVVYVLASGALYSVNTNDQSVTTYDKTKTLSDCDIAHIAWCAAARRLVIVYSNQNIDLLEESGNAVNIYDLYSYSTTSDKTVNSIDIYGTQAYLSTNFGVVNLNVKDAEITNTYNLGLAVAWTHLDDEHIYAESKSMGQYSALLTDNLLDPASWTRSGSYTAKDTSISDDLLQTAQAYRPDGPTYNYFGFLKMHDGKLYSCNGGTWDTLNDASIQILDEDGEWTVYSNEGIDTQLGIRYGDILSMDVDPLDERHVVACSQYGVFEYYDGVLTKYWNYENSPIYFYTGLEGNVKYQMITSVIFDEQGDLWVANSASLNVPMLKLSADGEWSELGNSLSAEYTRNLKWMGFDDDNYLWLYNDYWYYPAVYRYNLSTEELEAYDNFTDEDDNSYTVLYCHALAEDMDGIVWVGTDVGAFLLTEEYKENPGTGFYRVKIARNDGTDLADYLLDAVEITAIAVDNANRKWIGTNGNGIYVISEDNMEEVHHFTAAGSYLLSDNIESLAIDANGKVYIGTDKGLCSYQSEATAVSETMTKDNVYAYPNPVRPDYAGLITIVGLSYNAEVKITASNGTLVAEGRSTGGSFQWDGNDLKGRRVASGVYMVQASSEDGTRGVVCKVAIVN